MENDDDHNVIVLLIVAGSAIFVVVSMYRVLTIWFCHHQSTTADQDPPQPPPLAATPSLGERASSSIVHLIPTHMYHKRNKVDVVSDDEGEGGTCAVCLGDFEEGDELKTMPECLHSFHVHCIDMWLRSHSSCPICRAGAGAAPLPAMSANHRSIDMNMAPLGPVRQSGLLRW